LVGGDRKTIPVVVAEFRELEAAPEVTPILTRNWQNSDGKSANRQIGKSANRQIDN